jgi:hypothetical protein
MAGKNYGGKKLWREKKRNENGVTLLKGNGDRIWKVKFIGARHGPAAESPIGSLWVVRSNLARVYVGGGF